MRYVIVIAGTAIFFIIDMVQNDAYWTTWTLSAIFNFLRAVGLR